MKAILLITLLPFLGILSLTAEPDNPLGDYYKGGWIVKGLIHKAYAVKAPANHLLPEGFHDLGTTEDGHHMVLVLAIAEAPQGCPIPKGGYTILTPVGSYQNPWPRFDKLRKRIPVSVRIVESPIKGVFTFALLSSPERTHRILASGPYVQMLSQD